MAESVAILAQAESAPVSSSLLCGPPVALRASLLCGAPVAFRASLRARMSAPMISDTPGDRAAKRARLGELEAVAEPSDEQLVEMFALTSSDARRTDIEECLETEAWFDGSLKLIQEGGGGKTSEVSARKGNAMSGVQRKVTEYMARVSPGEKDAKLAEFKALRGDAPAFWELATVFAEALPAEESGAKERIEAYVAMLKLAHNDTMAQVPPHNL